MTRKMKTLTLIATTFTATTAFAMTELDTNGDGVLSMEEVQAVYTDMTEEQFIEADANADGLIDETELAAAREAGLIPQDQG